MTRTITLFTATVGAALVFAVPASGGNWGADQNQSSARVSPDLVELLSAKNGVVPYEALSAPVPVRGARFIDELLRAKNGVVPSEVLSGPVPVRAHGSSKAPSNPVATSNSAGSGIELDRSQVGIGFGVGIVLALGVVLGLWYVRIRPVAH